MVDNPRWPHVRIPIFALPENCPGMNPSRLTTYTAIRSFCYFRTAANPGFGRCTASLATLSKRSGQSRATLCRNIEWLEDRFLLYRRRGGYNRPNVITPVDFPKAFELACKQDGIAKAIEDLESDADERRADTWKENAEAASHRRRDISLVRPGYLTGETREVSPVRRGTSHRRDHKNDFFEERSSEELYREEHAPSKGDGVVSFTEICFPKREKQPGEQPKPLSEAETVYISPAELKSQLRTLGRKSNGNGKPFVSQYDPYDHETMKRIRAQCEARERGRRE